MNRSEYANPLNPSQANFMTSDQKVQLCMPQLSLSYSALSGLLVAWPRVVPGFMNGPRIWSPLVTVTRTTTITSTLTRDNSGS